MPKYIEVEALGVDRCDPDVVADRAYAAGWNGLINIINSAPAADVAPVVHGRWTFGKTVCGTDMYRCSECGRVLTIGLGADPNVQAPYCHCGALMDGKDEDNGI